MRVFSGPTLLPGFFEALPQLHEDLMQIVCYAWTCPWPWTLSSFATGLPLALLPCLAYLFIVSPSLASPLHLKFDAALEKCDLSQVNKPPLLWLVWVASSLPAIILILRKCRMNTQCSYSLLLLQLFPLKRRSPSVLQIIHILQSLSHLSFFSLTGTHIVSL